MKTPSFAKTCLSGHGIKLAAMAGAVASLLCNPVTAWSSPTLLADSYVSTPFVPGVRHGAAAELLVNKTNSGFFKFTLTSSLPSGTVASDINKAALKVFISKVNAGGYLTLRQVSQTWNEKTIPAAGIPPALNALKKTFRIRKSFAGHWVLLDVTDMVKDWATIPASNRGLALTVEGASLLNIVINSKENTDTAHEAVLDVVLNKTVGATGPAGAVGATGPAGAVGATGPAGTPGATGPAGAPGATGSAGTPGATGPAGTPGATGPAGAVGATGPAGAPGATGSAGTPGATGPAGTPGATGPAGTPGATGPAGTPGATGPAGTPGATGPAGTPGATGPAGTPGATGQAGTPGATGPAGTPGATGPAGTPGATGPAGTPGATGPAGAPGATGSAGTPGATGPAGAPGATGPAGTPGATGPAGAPGATGPAGTPGATGPAGATGATGPGTIWASTASVSIDNTGVLEYYGMYLFNASAPSNTQVNHQLELPVGCTMGNFRASVTTAPNNGAGTQTWTLGIMNAASSVISCNISENATSCTSATTSVAAAGNLITFYYQATSGTPVTAPGVIRWSATCL